MVGRTVSNTRKAHIPNPRLAVAEGEFRVEVILAIFVNARDTFLEYKFRHKNDLPIVTKKFSDVAKLAIADMRKQLDAGLGRKVFADYIVCIERYLIPFFGAQFVTSIDYDKIQAFYEWRRERWGVSQRQVR